jgi:hypothetical protein
MKETVAAKATAQTVAGWCHHPGGDTRPRHQGGEDLHGVLQRAVLGRAECRERRQELLDDRPRTLGDQGTARVGDADERHSGILRIPLALDRTGVDERVDDLGHRRLADVHLVGEVADAPRARIHEQAERAVLRRGVVARRLDRGHPVQLPDLLEQSGECGPGIGGAVDVVHPMTVSPSYITWQCI